MKKDLQEKKLIQEVVTTPYEKVFSILHNIKKLLITLSGPNNLYKPYANDIDWVIKSLTRRELYTFDFNDTKLPKKSSKLKDVIECISDYSSLQKRTIQDVRKGFNLNMRNSERRLKLKSFKANTSQLKQIEELKKANQGFIFKPIRSHSQKQIQKSESEKSSSSSNENALFGNKYPDTIQMEMFSNFYDLRLILSVDFDMMDFKNVIGFENVLPVIGRYLFEKFGFVNNNIINSSKLDSFLLAMNDGYFSSSVYHNSIHGADVTQTIALFLNNSKIEEMLQTNVIDIISLLSASLGHDLGHPGMNNTYHVNTMDDLAITYNDNSVLENFHIANFFRISKREECNIYETFSPIEFKSLRKRVISCILATDIVYHGKVVGIVRNKLTQLSKNEGIQEDFDQVNQLVQMDSPNSFNEQQEYLDFLIHIADIGHNTKKFEVSKQWVDLLNIEFWLQGEKEKEISLPISFLCDRNTANTPKSQVGFISAFIIPSFEVLRSLCPSLEVFLINAKENLKEWENLLVKYEKQQKNSSKSEKKYIEKSKSSNSPKEDRDELKKQ